MGSSAVTFAVGGTGATRGWSPTTVPSTPKPNLSMLQSTSHHGQFNTSVYIVYQCYLYIINELYASSGYFLTMCIYPYQVNMNTLKLLMSFTYKYYYFSQLFLSVVINRKFVELSTNFIHAELIHISEYTENKLLSG